MADNYGQWYVTKMFTDAEAAAAASSNKITFLRMIASTDVFAQEDLATMTNNTISTIKATQTALIAGVIPANGTYKVQGVFTNTGVTDDYLMNTILLVASYNGSEFLAAAQVAKQPFKMPAAGTTEQTVYTIGAQIVVSNTATVNLTLDPKALVTNEALKIITDAQADKDAAQDEATKTLSDKVPLFATLADAQTFSGIKTFTEKIIGSITGTADKAVALVTGRNLKVKLNSTADRIFDGTADAADIGVSGILPITNGGTSNAVGRAQGVNGNGLIFNSLAVGGTVVATAPLTSNYAKMFGSFGLNMAGSPLANKIFHCIVTNDGTDKMDIIAVAKVTGETFMAQVAGTIDDVTFTVTTAPKWTQVFTEKTVVPIANGGTGNASGLAVGQSSGAKLTATDDLNNIATTIQYTLNGATPLNAPTDAKTNYGFVIVQTREDNGLGFVVQRYITTANEEFIRSKAGQPMTWTPWVRINNNSTPLPVANGGTGNANGLAVGTQNKPLATIKQGAVISGITQGVYNFLVAGGATNGMPDSKYYILELHVNNMLASTSFTAIAQSTDSTGTENKLYISQISVSITGNDATVLKNPTWTEIVTADGDITWTDISPINGFSLIPSTGSNGVLKYKVQNNVLYVSVRGVVVPALTPATPTPFVELPFIIPQNTIAGFIGPNVSTSLYAKEVCTIQSTGADKSILYAKNSTTTAGDRFSGMFIVPMK